MVLWGGKGVLERCVGVTVHRLLGGGVRGLVSVMKLSIKVLYFDVYLCYDQFVDRMSSYFSGGRLVTSVGLYAAQKSLCSNVPTAAVRRLHGLEFSRIRSFAFAICPQRQDCGMRVGRKGRLPCSRLVAVRMSSLFEGMFAPQVLRKS